MQERTPEQEFLGQEEDDYNSPQYESFLENFFSLGSIDEKTYDLFDDYKVKLRVLLPAENIEVSKEVGKVDDIISKEQILKIEILARAIVNINGRPLRFSDDDLPEWREWRGIKDPNYKPSEIEQMRHYLRWKIKDPLKNLIYSKYSELLSEQEQLFNELKKK